MAKRVASTELNHDNWQDEDEPEDAGTFKKASEDTIKTRKIKVARRRNLGTTEDDEDKPKMFEGFKFTKSETPALGPKFNFLSFITNKTDSKTNGTSEEQGKDDKLKEYYSKLKGLNEGVLEWIKKHVTSNPLINLTPVFKDYEKHIADLEKLKVAVDSKPLFSFGPAPSLNLGAPLPSFGGGSLASTVTLSSESPKTSFSFGNSASKGFSFTSTVIKPADPPQVEEENDEPPKVEFTPVVEEGHVYTSRCKVFVKNAGSFGDRGVGTLYIKSVPDSAKYQVFVRADTNLGNLLCNFILSESIPTKRMGKKDVMLVCIPTPDAKPPPVPILFRVKNSEEADELLNVLDKYRK